MRNRVSAFSVVWEKREYRAFLLIMVCSSLGVSSSMPLVSLYLVHQLHLALSVAGLFSASQALPGVILGALVGRWSDRWRSRLPALRLAAAWAAIGWLVFAFSPYAWLTLSVGALFLSATFAIMGQVFASVHDVMTRDRETQPELINTAVRTGFSLGFVVGPLLGTELAALVSFRVAFIVTACLWLLCLVPLHGLQVAVPSSAGQGEAHYGRASSNRLLYLFAGLCMLVMCGTGLKNTYLPIDVTTRLGGTVSLYGTLMIVSPVVELVVMPVSGLLALRFSIGRLIAVGLVLAVIEYLVLSLSTALWQLYITQAVDAVVIAVLSGLGMTYAQRLTPNRPGLASGVFSSVFGVAVVVGNVIGSVSVPFLGIPHIFFIATLLCGVSLLTFAGVDRAARRQSEPVSARISA
jgi:SET family sugar efflux transporter-like MFS transporter